MAMVSPLFEISWHIIVYSFTNFCQSPSFHFTWIPILLFLAGMAARASGNSNLDGDYGQPDAPIQQQIVSPSIQMIVADAAGNGGRVETGGATKGKGLLGPFWGKLFHGDLWYWLCPLSSSRGPRPPNSYRCMEALCWSIERWLMRCAPDWWHWRFNFWSRAKATCLIDRGRSLRHFAPMWVLGMSIWVSAMLSMMGRQCFFVVIISNAQFSHHHTATKLYPDTIRAIFGQDWVHNAIHCTDLPKDGVIECK